MKFNPTTPLEKRIVEGDVHGTFALLDGMTPAERKDLGPRVMEVAVQMQPWARDRRRIESSWAPFTDGQREAIAVAVLACGEPRDASYFWYLPAHRVEQLVARFRPADRAQLAEAFARRGHPAAAARLGQHAFDDEGLLQLMQLPYHRSDDAETYIVEYIDDLRDPLLRLLDIEGTGDVNLSSIDKYTKGTTWAALFMMLCDRGVYTREDLISRCLLTLEFDWPQFRSGWFSRMHDLMAPSADEMIPHAARYLALLRSRIPPTVTLALKAAAALWAARQLAPVELVESLEPVMTSQTKAHIIAALKLLDKASRAAPELTPQAARLAVAALQHPSPEAQEAVLHRLRDWNAVEAVREELSIMAPLVAPSLHGLLASVAPGGATASRQRRRLEEAGSREPMQSLDESLVLQPVTEVDDLVALCGRVLEHDGGVDDMEQALAALCLLAPMPDETRKRFAPIVKRARKVKQVQEAKRAIAREFARFLVFVVAGERIACVWSGHSPAAMLGERIDDTIEFVRAGAGLVPLDCATHRLGFIDPDVLAERLAACQAKNIQPPHGMQVRALLRLAPGRPQRRCVTDTAMAHALRYATGADIPAGADAALLTAASRIRHPLANDKLVLERYGDLGPDSARAAQVSWRFEKRGSWGLGVADVSPVIMPVAADLIAPRRYLAPPGESEALVLYAASILPSSLEAVYAHGLNEISNNIQWSEASWHHKGYVRLLAEPTTRITPAAELLLAFALMGKEPGQLALAVDAFVAAIGQQRLQADRLATALASFLPTPMFMAARLTGALAAASRASPQAAAAVLVAACELLRHIPQAAPPNGLAGLLQLAADIAAEHGFVLPPEALASARTLQLKGKAKAVLDKLVAFDPG